MLVTGPTLGASPAHAADPASVTFTGGSVLGVLACKSQPSIGRISLPAQSKVTFVNRLGAPATLRVDGKAVASVAANQAVPVVFHYGPVSVSMAYECEIGVAKQFESVTVDVAAAAPAARGATTPAAPSRSTAPVAPSRRTDAAGVPRAGQPSVAAQPGAEQGSVPPEVPDGLPTDPSAAAAPDAGALPPGAPGASAAAGNDGAVDVGSPELASGEPYHRVSGLLALVATVCTIGVTIAAIRAMLSSRMRRARFA
jgi:hypothetical protein